MLPVVLLRVMGPGVSPAARGFSLARLHHGDEDKADQPSGLADGQRQSEISQSRADSSTPNFRPHRRSPGGKSCDNQAPLRPVARRDMEIPHPGPEAGHTGQVQ